MRYPIFHHPGYVASLPAGHRFPMSKYAAVVEELKRLGSDDFAEFHSAEPVPRAVVERAHEVAYVAQLFALDVDPAIEKRIGFPVTEQVLRRARYSSGGTLAAARRALEVGAASNAAGGSHHAHPGFGSGYCVLNDVGVAASQLLAEGAVERILVVDLDVHQGDGTAAMFAAEPRVFTFSMHCEANFPVRKMASDLDVGLPVGMGDADYLSLLETHLPRILERHRPRLVFYNAGVDVHAEDRLGRLSLTDEGLAARDRYVARCCLGAGIPFVTVMGGGYGADVSVIARRHARSIVIAAEVWRQAMPGPQARAASTAGSSFKPVT
ncbi:histone deacetylase family protein [Pedomonas sp. V897]|uniref:histone deacetylase family protein n=1 Tax=Pedomonas sp. V897 TaxID=3446482 RepID=UPI003EE21CFA